MATGEGLEPSLSSSKPDVLPLDYPVWSRRLDLNQRFSLPKRVANLTSLPLVVAEMGVEPTILLLMRQR